MPMLDWEYDPTYDFQPKPKKGDDQAAKAFLERVKKEHWPSLRRIHGCLCFGLL